jgi:hypothetical protein
MDSNNYGSKADLNQAVSTPKSKLDWARAYAKAGWPVFPCEPNGKAPLGRLAPRGCYSATDDLAQIGAWWTECPEANIGVYPGPVGGTVIDLDDKNGVNGKAELRKARPELADMIDLGLTFGDDTPSGGQHIYVKGATGSANGVLPGVDIKSVGGYVLGAGSTINGKPYKLRDGAPLGRPDDLALDLPADLAARTAPKRETRTPGPVEMACELDFPHNVEAAENWIEGVPSIVESEHWEITLPSGATVTGVGRDNLAYQISHALMSLAIGQANAMRMLGEWDSGNPKPLGADVLAQKWQSARRGRQSPIGEDTPEGRHAELCKKFGLDWNAAEANDGDGEINEGDDNDKTTTWSKLIETAADASGKACAPKWLIKGILPEGGNGALAGREKTGKSFTALDMSLHLANGEPWHGRVTQQVPVLYLAGEHADGVRRRVKAWHLHHGRDVAASCLFQLLPINVEIEAEVGTLIKLVKSMPAERRPKLIIFDTLTRALGRLDPSKPDHANIATKMLAQLADATGATVLAVGHRSKGAKGEASIFGSVFFQANADFVLFLDRKDDHPKGYSELPLGLSRDAAAGDPLPQQIIGVEIEGWEDTVGVAVSTGPQVARSEIVKVAREGAAAEAIQEETAKEKFDETTLDRIVRHFPQGKEIKTGDLVDEYIADNEDDPDYSKDNRDAVRRRLVRRFVGEKGKGGVVRLPQTRNTPFVRSKRNGERVFFNPYEQVDRSAKVKEAMRRRAEEEARRTQDVEQRRVERAERRANRPTGPNASDVSPFTPTTIQ